MKCDIIIPIWNELESTKSCIEHVMKNTDYPYRLILIDNGSDAETENYLKNMKANKAVEIELIRNERNLGFVKAVNQGLKISNAAYVAVLNNDTEPGIGWLSELVEFVDSHPGVGLANPLCNGHVRKNMSINEYAEFISSNNKGKFMEMNQCQGFSMLIKRDVIDKIGYLDERFGIGGFDDTDYSMRAHIAGYRSVCVYSSYVWHKEHVSFDRMGERKELQQDAEKEYFKKWPRHLRIAIIFFVSKRAEDAEIANFLKTSLFFARRWCWVNLLIFGSKNINEQIDAVKEKIDFPLHQNIKFNYLSRHFAILEIGARILERSFGSKRRKKYDAVICNEPNLTRPLNILCSIQGCTDRIIDFHSYSECGLSNIIEPLRSEDGASRLQMGGMKCDIILPVCDQYEFTKKCIESIIKNTDTPYRLIIINNGKNTQTRGLLDRLERDKTIKTTIVHNDRNIGWVKALNRGIGLSDAPYVCFQNDDTVVTRGWVRKMINILNLQDNFGMINPTWEGRPRSISIDRYNAVLEKNNRRYIETDWCRGFCVVMKRPVIEKIGNVNEIYGLAYFDDVDYSVTSIEAGFLCLKALDTYVYHHRNVTFFEILKGPKWNELHERNKLIYYKRWGRPLRILIVLDAKTLKNRIWSDGIITALYYLARKQHRLYVWCPDKKVCRELSHTNIIARNYPSLFLNRLLDIDLYFNLRKKEEKQYDAVFASRELSLDRLSRKFKGLNFFNNNDQKDFSEFVKNTVAGLKERTKESINVEM